MASSITGQTPSLKRRESTATREGDQLTITPLEAGNEVGRSCIFMSYRGKTVLFDCGIHPAFSGMAALPYFDEINPSAIDVLLVTQMIDAKLFPWIYPLVYILVLLKVEGLYVNITYLESAVAKGAVCLDGSPPAYHLSRGFGTGVNSWLVHMEGGGWCNNVTTCLERKNTRLGSSKHMLMQLPFSGILSNEEASNPFRYCDGSSFTGDVETVDPATNLHYRGARIWLAVMEDLLAKGMRDAENALLSGCSAGGLTSILHCDRFRALLPTCAKVKCLSDAGYFVNVKNIAGEDHIRTFFNDVVTTHGSATNLPSSCTYRLAPPMCFFPQYSVELIQTPLFILNAAYDSWQVKNILLAGIVNPHGTWRNCKLGLSNCSSTQLQIIQDFRMEFLRALPEIGSSLSKGMFINSCYIHCQSEMQETWHGAHSPVLDSTSIAEAVGGWFYDGNPFQKIDCPYPCDSSCPIHVKSEA